MLVICPAVIHIIAQGDRIHHGLYDEHLLAGPKDLVGDIPGCRAAEDHALSNQSEHKAVMGAYLIQGYHGREVPPHSLIGHEATVHGEIV